MRLKRSHKRVSARKPNQALEANADSASLRRHRSAFCSGFSFHCEIRMTTMLANQAASLERRDSALIPIEDHWRGVGEPRR